MSELFHSYLGNGKNVTCPPFKVIEKFEMKAFDGMTIVKVIS
jgi:hypothetical protein